MTTTNNEENIECYLCDDIETEATGLFTRDMEGFCCENCLGDRSIYILEEKDCDVCDNRLICEDDFFRGTCEDCLPDDYDYSKDGFDLK